MNGSLTRNVLETQYPIKDLGECNWILNMKVTRNRTERTITLSQEAYVKRTIKLYGMDASRIVSTPAVPGHDVSSCLSKTMMLIRWTF